MCSASSPDLTARARIRDAAIECFGHFGHHVLVAALRGVSHRDEFECHPDLVEGDEFGFVAPYHSHSAAGQTFEEPLGLEDAKRLTNGKPGYTQAF